MKVLIIENEWDTDISIKAFLKDNPNLFESICIETNCLHRNPVEILQTCKDFDTILIATTFMYKDQISEYVEKLINYPKTLNFFVKRAVRHFNELKNSIFIEDRELFYEIAELTKKGHKIFDFHEDLYKERNIETEVEYNSGKRSPFIYEEVFYNKEYKLFYTDEENLKDQRLLELWELKYNGYITEELYKEKSEEIK